MAAQATVTLTDGQSTPVNHAFNPNGVTAGVAMWRNTVGGIAAGFEVLTSSIRETKNGPKPGNVVTLKLNVPVMETISGADLAGYTPQPSVAFELEAIVTFRAPARCTKQQRKDLRVMLADLLAESVTVAAVDDLEQAW
jgi:hypothetical protein